MPDVRRDYSQGAVDSRGRDDLRPGEMQQATGVTYKPGDQRAHKTGGRATFGDTSTGKKIDGLKLLQFDSGGTDQLVALSNRVLYSATPGVSGTFTTLYTPTESLVSLDSAHALDRHYMALGGENRVLLSDGTTRQHGMKAPEEGIVSVAKTSGGSIYRPADDPGGGWTNPNLVKDADLTTYASASSAALTTTTWTWATQTASVKHISILWSIGTPVYANPDVVPPLQTDSLGGSVLFQLELSEDNGANFTKIFRIVTTKIQGLQGVQYPISSVDLDQVQLRASYLRVVGQTPPARIFDIKIIEAGSNTSNFSATDVLYAYTEVLDTGTDTDEDDEGDFIESIPSTTTSVTLSSENTVQLTLPSSLTNSNATRRNIYRTAANGTFSQLAYIGTLDATQTLFIDDFQDFPIGTVPPRQVDLVTVRAAEGNLRFYRNGYPPNLKRIEYFNGSLVGLPEENPRSLRYSQAGFPEYWPSIYTIAAFPLPEHDELQEIVSIGQSLIIGAKATMIRMDELPRPEGGAFIISGAEQIKGAPGVVGPEAMTAVNYQGISNVAWISPQNGILVTDGDRWDSIADDVDWSQFDGWDKSGWVLHWIQSKRVLLMAYSSTVSGNNDRFMLLHLDKDHLKANGQAKVTWPHYGAINVITSGQVANTERVYEGHTSDGKIYLDFSTIGNDASNALNASGTHRLQIKGQRKYEEPDLYQLVDATLHHTDFGTGQTCTVAIEVGRDETGSSETRTSTVSLAGHQQERFNILRSGEWAEETITHDGTGQGAVRDLRIRANRLGREGEFKRVS